MSRRRGEIAELHFQLTVYEKGYECLRVHGDNKKYDWIVDLGKGKFSRVQVKSTAQFIETSGGGAYSITALSGGGIKKVYNKKDIDILACYVEPENSWYIIPVEKLKTKSIRLYPHRVNEEGYYERYKEAWNCLMK